MGTWSSKPFGNDSALDWIAELAGARDDQLIDRTLSKVANSGGIPDASDCEEAVAAAALVCAGSRDPLPKIPEEAREWVITRGFVPNESQIRLASAALGRVLDDSELAELWKESGSAKAHRKALVGLIEQLNSIAIPELPQRRPRPAPTPRLLSKLIPRIKPSEKSPRRAALQQKLQALVDVNAPLPGTFYSPPLCVVAQAGLDEEALLLVSLGADVNLESGMQYPPLLYAAMNGHEKVVEILLGQGARLFKTLTINHRTKAPTTQNDPEGAPFVYAMGLFAAARGGFIDVIRTLVKNGADLQQRDLNGDTLLHKAAEGTADVSTIDYLVDCGIDVNGKKPNNESPLHYAVRAGRIDVAKRLLALGAFPNLVVRHDGTALDIAKDPEIAQALKEHGGKSESEL